MLNNPVGWFDIYVEDLDRAKKFYEAVFETKLEYMSGGEMEMLMFPMDKDVKGRTSGCLAKMKGISPGGNSVLVYFICEDCEVESARVPEHGGRIHKKKFSIGENGFVSLVFDTENNMIGLHSMK